MDMALNSFDRVRMLTITLDKEVGLIGTLLDCWCCAAKIVTEGNRWSGANSAGVNSVSSEQ